MEVHSDSTEAYDRGKQFGYYRACPHMHEYVLIASTHQTVEVYRRTWCKGTYEAYRPGDDAELASIGVGLLLALHYRNAGVPAGVDGSVFATLRPCLCSSVGGATTCLGSALVRCALLLPVTVSSPRAL